MTFKEDVEGQTHRMAMGRLGGDWSDDVIRQGLLRDAEDRRGRENPSSPLPRSFGGNMALSIVCFWTLASRKVTE